MVLRVVLCLMQYSRGSRNTSSCVTVQAMQAVGIASKKSQATWINKAGILSRFLFKHTILIPKNPGH